MRSLSKKGEVESEKTSRTRPDPMRKLRRDKSMAESRRRRRDVGCCCASPVHMVRLDLSNPSFQRGNEALTAASLKRRRSNSHSWHLDEQRSLLRAWIHEIWEGNERAPTCTHRLIEGKTGSPTGCEPYGDGPPIVVAGVMTRLWSMGKPCTRRRGSLSNQGRRVPLTKERRGGVI
jgi:hypothetical protein